MFSGFDPNVVDRIREKYAQGAVLTFEDIENLITAVDYWRHGAAQEHKLMIEMFRRVNVISRTCPICGKRWHSAAEQDEWHCQNCGCLLTPDMNERE